MPILIAEKISLFFALFLTRVCNHSKHKSTGSKIKMYSSAVTKENCTKNYWPIILREENIMSRAPAETFHFRIRFDSEQSECFVSTVTVTAVQYQCKEWEKSLFVATRSDVCRCVHCYIYVLWIMIILNKWYKQILFERLSDAFFHRCKTSQ